MAQLACHPWDFFFSGLAFVWLAAVANALRRRPNESWPWAWLAWFAVLHGAGLWTEMLALGQAALPAVKTVRLTLAAGSLAALFEFGRRGIGRLGGRTWGNRVYAPLIGLAGLGALAVALLYPSSFCLAAGLPGQLAAAACALAAATGLWRHGHKAPAMPSGLFRRWQTPAVAALVVATGWAAMHWRDGRAQGEPAQAAVIYRTASTDQDAGAEEPVEVQPGIEMEEQAGPAARESLATRRLRSSLPLLLVNLGIAALLLTVWALAQRFSRW